MPRFCAVLTFLLTFFLGFSVCAGDIFRTSPYHLTTSRPFAGGSKFNIFQDGYIYGAINIPLSSKTSDGIMKAGYGIGFDGTVFVMDGLGILTHFSTTYHSVDLTQSQLKGGAFTYWIMPGVLYEYELKSTRTEVFAVHGLAMAGVEIYKPDRSLNETGSSGSLSCGFGVGMNYNYIKIGIRYIFARPKFEYTIYPNDYNAELKSSFLQITLGYTFDFFPRRNAH